MALKPGNEYRQRWMIDIAPCHVPGARQIVHLVAKDAVARDRQKMQQQFGRSDVEHDRRPGGKSAQVCVFLWSSRDHGFNRRSRPSTTICHSCQLSDSSHESFSSDLVCSLRTTFAARGASFLMAALSCSSTQARTPSGRSSAGCPFAAA